MTKPIVLSLFVADDFRHEDNGKYLVVGGYLDVRLSDDPSSDPRNIQMVAFVTDLAEGEHTVSVVVTDLRGKKEMRGKGYPHVSPDLKAISILIQELSQFYFPTPGPYQFDLLINDELVGFTRMNVQFEPSEPRNSGDGKDKSRGKRHASRKSAKKK